MGQQPTGIHHLAFMAGDIKKHIAFFSQVMGCPLVALFDMHGVPGGLHAFLRMNDHSYFSIVQLPKVDEIPIEIGKTHAGNGALPSAPGTLQHLAFRADSDEDLLAMRDRIRSHGVNVIGPIDHGMCRSIYFAGPDQMTLEVACSTEAIDPARWIDPAELAKAGIGPVLLPAGLLALVGEQGKRASPLPGLGRPLHLVYRPSSLKRDRIARLVQALQAHFRHLSSQG